MKDQKRRRTLKAHFSKDTSQTTSTRHSVSAEPLRLSGAAVHSDAAQATPARAAPGKDAAVLKRAYVEAESPNAEKKSGHKRPTPPALQCTKNGAHSVRSPGSVVPNQSAAQNEGLANDRAAGTKEKFQYDDIGIEKGCEFARLLSRLIRARDEAEYASSDEYSCPTGAQIPLKSKRDKVKYPRTGRIMVNTDAVVRGQRGANVPGTFPYPCGVISREVRQKSAARKPALAMHTDTGTTKLLQEPRASKRKPLMERFVSKAADRQTPQLLQAVRNTILDNNKRNIIAETGMLELHGM
ncbi:hypothetical protein HPB50_021457 [Hyalomma asiaticum]|uniref:Uncharacterized protein n=1 Tax=Hyalomma asiaticum TaxID=266040 RepID=A0ACB7SAP3_HYAAI|nr:hypothetical protein HPB50_021457 [Hyalomma asiaticum]